MVMLYFHSNMKNLKIMSVWCTGGNLEISFTLYSKVKLKYGFRVPRLRILEIWCRMSLLILNCTESSSGRYRKLFSLRNKIQRTYLKLKLVEIVWDHHSGRNLKTILLVDECLDLKIKMQRKSRFFIMAISLKKR